MLLDSFIQLNAGLLAGLIRCCSGQLQTENMSV